MMILAIIAYIGISLFVLGFMEGKITIKLGWVEIVSSILWPLLLVIILGGVIFIAGANMRAELKGYVEDAETNEKG